MTPRTPDQWARWGRKEIPASDLRASDGPASLMDMSTATTTDTCGACGAPFASVAEVFGHDCPGTRSYNRRSYSSNRPTDFVPATDAQKALAIKLADQLGGQDPATWLVSRDQYFLDLFATGKEGLKRAIPALLEQVKALPPVAPKAPAAAPKATVRTNRYAGRCGNCGQVVEAESGVLEPPVEHGAKWRVWHIEGECPSSTFPFPDGRYAVATDEGHLAFYHCFKGVVVLVTGPSEVKLPVKTAKAVVAKIAVDPEAASRAYGREIGSCGRCGRRLTDEESRAAGIGPVCAGKGW